MDVGVHKSPFQFSPTELPVVMLFPATDKRPLEFSGELSAARLKRFAGAHARTLQDDSDLRAPKDEV